MLLRDPALRQRIGISTEQAAKIQGQESTFVKARIRDRADLQVKHMELRDLMGAEKPDRAAIDKKLREISEVRLAAEKSSVEHQLAMRDALTPEQKEKMREALRERMQQGGMPGPQGHMPGPDGRQGPPRPPTE